MYQQIKSAIELAAPELSRVDIERWWPYNEREMPAVNIREVRFDTEELDIRTSENRYSFAVIVHYKTDKADHEVDVEAFYALRNKISQAVGSVDPTIELEGGENLGEMAEFTFLGTVLKFSYRCRKGKYEI